MSNDKAHLCTISADQEKQALDELVHWDILPREMGGREIHRVYQFASFDDAFKFMSDAVSLAIVPQNHHPRWQNQYHRVEVWLSTSEHNNEITARDIKLANALEGIWQSYSVGSVNRP